MIAAWMVYAIEMSAIFAVAAVAIEHGLRRVRLPGRWVVAAAMLAAFLVPMVMRTSPAIPADELVSIPIVAPRIPIPEVVSVLPATDRLANFDIPLVVLWAGLTVVLLSLLVGTQVGVVKASRGYSRETVDGIPVLRSRNLGPAVVGWLKGAIVLPSWFDNEDHDRRSMMILHEREHLRGWDSQLQAAALLAVAVQPWNLPLWWMMIRLRSAIELDCDMRVLRSGVDVRAYSHLLLDMSVRRGQSAFPLMAFAVTRPFLARRFDHIAVSVSRASYVPGVFATAVGAACVLLACTVQPPVQADEEDQPISGEIAEPPVDSAGTVLSFSAPTGDSPVAVMPVEEFLDKVARLADVMEAFDTSALAGVSDDVLARLRHTAVLLQVMERDGKPTVLMRELSARGREQLRRINAIEMARARQQNP